MNTKASYSPVSVKSASSYDDDFNPRDENINKKDTTDTTDKKCEACQKVKPTRKVLSPSYHLRCFKCDQSRSRPLTLSSYENDFKCGEDGCAEYGATKYYYYCNICYDCKARQPDESVSTVKTISLKYYKGWNMQATNVSISCNIVRTIREALDGETSHNFYGKDRETVIAIVIKFDKESIFVTDFSKTFTDLGVPAKAEVTFIAWRRDDKRMESD